MSTKGPTPLPVFDEIRERLLPLVAGHGFRPGPIEREAVNAYAEFWRKGVRLRLVWEGNERTVWVETAPDADAQVVGRWQDIEWIEAGERLPVDYDLSAVRVDRLLAAVERFLAARPRV
ncbi:MAG TPA: hypothetical protein VMK53_02645 [Gemmatimonadales bacterium]|nr:hypothetical protein [Gemmatimonadales bacterium]